MKNRTLTLTISVLCLSLFVLCLFYFNDYVLFADSKNLSNSKKIIIDAGHGGYDGGAIATDGTNEKDVNLKIAQNLKEFLTSAGFEVIMTREEDVSTDGAKGKYNKITDLKNRLKLMEENKDAIFVSIHLNKFTSSAATGAQVFYSANDENSKLLAQDIQNTIRTQLQPENDRMIKKATSSIYILKNAKVPAVIVECGFLSNIKELEKLKDEKYQRMMAFSIFCGIIEYHNNQ